MSISPRMTLPSVLFFYLDKYSIHKSDESPRYPFFFFFFTCASALKKRALGTTYAVAWPVVSATFDYIEPVCNRSASDDLCLRLHLET